MIYILPLALLKFRVSSVHLRLGECNRGPLSFATRCIASAPPVQVTRIVSNQVYIKASDINLYLLTIVDHGCNLYCLLIK